MSTQSQIDANRANAQKSSGPVTDAGKAASSQNHASHRLSHYASFEVLPHEDQSAFSRLLRDLLSEFSVGDRPAERAIVVRMV